MLDDLVTSQLDELRLVDLTRRQSDSLTILTLDGLMTCRPDELTVPKVTMNWLETNMC